MSYELPDIDTLIKIGQSNPDQLDRIKRDAVNDLIESASNAHQERLKGLQWQVDMELKKSKSAMDGCIRVSEMMHEKLWELRAVLQSEEQGSYQELFEEETVGAEILPFRS